MSNRASKWIGIATLMTTMAATAGCGTGANNTANTTNTTGAGNQTTGITINETGSSLIYPLFNGQWISAYQSVDPNVHITAAATGSGAGISQAIAGTVQIGASDAYMADAQMQANPSMVNIPLAVSAQQVMYNLPGVSKDKHLNLTGSILAKIYSGQIQYWDDPSIKALNAGIALPHQHIVTVHRSDGSGDTFLFTQFLSKTNAAWNNSVHYGTTVSWPSVPGAIGAKGNSGVVQALAGNKFSIGYVGISWLDKATAQGLGYAALQNKGGKFVLPTSSSIQAAANAMSNQVPNDERISLINAPGANSYPIVNFEYAIVNTKQPSDMANALKKFLNWAIDPSGGNQLKYLAPVHFLPLPSNIEPKSKAQINKIGG
jgi:phosphate transport system substrate-binding protein